ncbi:MAG: DUF368 domain-containing protein [Lachnospiraceae bacterium]|nr:DUF368 domain-containing protein [Lachnospiraceae bacterium]MDE6185671.1 DUF368 domain-containing protein [Lachnospiraceae bacterium]MDE7286488.1 DUF368 domain-containing protein [Lachnospiraceae bacterium]
MRLVSGSFVRILVHVFQGALIGLGAVLPGISGGVLSVLFGVYKPLMEFLANPVHCFKSHVPRLLPYIMGYVIGFMGVANLLAFVLEKYPDPSVCLFVGLIAGMMPSLWKEAGLHGRSGRSFVSMFSAMFFVFVLLIGLRMASVAIVPGFVWYVFCGFCLALSIIAPGMSFSTLLMPLGLYAPFVDGIGHMAPEVLVPGGIGGVITIVCLSKAVNTLFDAHYSEAFHGIIGIIIAATVMIVPFEGLSLFCRSGLINVFFLAAGVFIAGVMDKLNAV